MPGKDGKWEFKKNVFARYVRKLNVHSGDVILFRDGSITEEGLKSFGEAINNLKPAPRNVILLVVQDVNEVRLISEIEMNKLGWFRIEALSKMVIDRSKGNASGKEETDETKSG